MMRPRLSRSMPLAARLASRKEPVRLVSITEDQSSSRHPQDQRVVR